MDRQPFTEAVPGLPLPELNATEQEAFTTGQALFNTPFRAEDGLGPVFNQMQCSSCHDLPTSGGHGAEPVTKASGYDVAEGCNVFEDAGGDLRQQSVTERARALGVLPERIPEGATAVSNIRPPAVYGLGLVAAIPEEDLRALADPDDLDGDGIAGRINPDGQGRAGRFGRKAQHATLHAFIEEAIRLEMGLTTPEHPEEEQYGGSPLPPGADPAPDPEVDDDQLGALEAYIRLLAPPVPRMPQSVEDREAVEEGERVFRFMGCPACHVEEFTTGPASTPALDRRRFRLYSDLLLHDMGPELADTCAPGTTPSEWKTARLVGLGHRFEFLHDGRAQTIENAILLHGGEAAASRDLFRRLNETARTQVLRFLQSL